MKAFAKKIEERDAGVIKLDSPRNTVYGKRRRKAHAMLHKSDGEASPSTDGLLCLADPGATQKRVVQVRRKATSEVPPLGVTADLSALLDTRVMNSVPPFRYTEAASVFQGVKIDGRHEAIGQNDAKAARRRRSEPRACP